jgi:uncharacterized protein YutE (UPF0331/DUF86 family)
MSLRLFKRLIQCRTCCGGQGQHSLYCESLEARDKFAKALEAAEAEKKKAEEYARFVTETRRGPWERREELNAQFTHDTDLVLAPKIDPKDPDNPESSANILMLTSWIHKNIDDEMNTVKGMELLLAHANTGEGCIHIFRHEGLRCLLEAQEKYPQILSLQTNCLKLLCQLLECNFTRPPLLSSPLLLTLAFNIGHRHLANPEIVELSVRCVLQCAREECCRCEIFERNLVGYYLLYCRQYSRVPAILRHILKLFNWIASSDERLVRLYQQGVASVVLHCMKRHMNNPAILAPCMLYLTRISNIHLPALDYLVQKEAVSLVIGALRALYSEEIIQLEALKMLQALSKSPEGWKQISATRGGWQSICQGTTQGNALIHDLKGSLHNPGWAIGETPHLPLLERRKLMAAQAAAAKGISDPKDSWTAHSLRQFMGLSMRPQRLAINVAEHQTYFDLLQSLDLLPNPGEEKEAWYQRLKDYERENEIQIQEMVDTVMEMTKKAAREEKLALRAEQDGEYIKPVYVLGERITTKALEESDIDVQAALRGVV